jgi:hypothetical protein
MQSAAEFAAETAAIGTGLIPTFLQYRTVLLLLVAVPYMLFSILSDRVGKTTTFHFDESGFCKNHLINHFAL